MKQDMALNPGVEHRFDGLFLSCDTKVLGC